MPVDQPLFVGATSKRGGGAAFDAGSGRLAGLASRIAAVTLAIVACLLCGAVVVMSLIAVYRYRDHMPFYDMILVDYEYMFGRARDFWLLPDNEHRPIFAMPLYWIELALLHDQEAFLVACNVALSAGIAAVPAWSAIRAARGDRLLGAIAVALIAALVFSLMNRVNLIWPKQVHMYLSILGLFVAFRRAASLRPMTGWGMLAVTGWLFVATFSFAYGVIGFPAVAILGVMRRWPVRAWLVLAVSFAAVMALYFQLTDGFAFLAHGGARPPLGGLLLFALTFIAAPVVAVGKAAGAGPWTLAIGQALTAAALAVYAWRAIRALVRPVSEAEALALLLAAFVAGNALQTSFARLEMLGQAGALEYRYVIGEVPFWIGLVLLGVEAVRRLPTPWRVLPAGAAAVVAALLLNANRQEERNLRWEAAYHWREVTGALTGVVDRPLLEERIWIDTQQLLRVIDGLRERQWSVFGWPQAHWVGMRASDFPAAPGRCAGTLRTVTALPGGGGTLLEGWAGNKRAPGWAAWIVLVDASGVITGLAHGGALDDWVATVGPGYTGWFGYNRGEGTPTPYLVLPGDRLCALDAAAK